MATALTVLVPLAPRPMVLPRRLSCMASSSSTLLAKALRKLHSFLCCNVSILTIRRSSIIAGMDRVLHDAPNRDCPNGVVVSMSFGETPSQGINDAAKALVDAGFFAAAAAGNGDDNGKPIDASLHSPASEPSICTIGATTKDDTVASFSNFGSVVDLYAPGVAVLSTWPGNITRSISGTSMATPHVAGLAAYFLGRGKPAAGLCEYLQSIALKNVIKGVPEGTKNLLVQNGRAK